MISVLMWTSFRGNLRAGFAILDDALAHTDDAALADLMPWRTQELLPTKLPMPMCTPLLISGRRRDVAVIGDDRIMFDQ